LLGQIEQVRDTVKIALPDSLLLQAQKNAAIQNVLLSLQLVEVLPTQRMSAQARNFDVLRIKWRVSQCIKM
jgi:hypothetical protein